jgi:hypothetical protein
MKKGSKIIRVRRVQNTCKIEDERYFEVYLTTVAEYYNQAYIFPCEQTDRYDYRWWEIQRFWKKLTYLSQNGKGMKYKIEAITKTTGSWIKNLGLDSLISSVFKTRI